ncbi:MAG: YdcF family protein [Burkholderiales bacterium]
MNELLFGLRKFMTVLVLPPTGPLLVAIVGLALMRRSPRVGRALAWGGVLFLLTLATPLVSYWLTRAASDTTPLDPTQASRAQAIVILAGGIRRNAPEYGGDTLSRLSLERARYGAKLAKQTGLPVLVSGGVVFRGRPESEVIRDALEQEFGVKVRWVETKSRDTRGNALYSAEILRAAGVSSVILVGHAFDIPRSRAEFEANGIEVIPAPTVIPVFTADQPLDFMPNMGALAGSYFACYELLGNAVRRLRPDARVTDAPVPAR